MLAAQRTDPLTGSQHKAERRGGTCSSHQGPLPNCFVHAGRGVDCGALSKRCDRSRATSTDLDLNEEAGPCVAVMGAGRLSGGSEQLIVGRFADIFSWRLQVRVLQGPGREVKWMCHTPPPP